jgi:hypothetical protein
MTNKITYGIWFSAKTSNYTGWAGGWFRKQYQNDYSSTFDINEAYRGLAQAYCDIGNNYNLEIREYMIGA